MLVRSITFLNLLGLFLLALLLLIMFPIRLILLMTSFILIGLDFLWIIGLFLQISMLLLIWGLFHLIPIGLLLQLFRVKEEVWELRSAGIWHKRERVREKKKRWEVRMRGQGRGRRDPDSFTLFPVVADGSTTTSTVQQAKKDKPPPPPVRFPNKQKPTPIKLEARHPFRANKILS